MQTLAPSVPVSFGLQVRSHRNATRGRFLNTSSMPFADHFLLLGVGVIALFIPEEVKIVRQARRQGRTER
jgi:hypothetical protein